MMTLVFWLTSGVVSALVFRKFMGKPLPLIVILGIAAAGPIVGFLLLYTFIMYFLFETEI